jgi:RNA ligase (TIGR02306 family)
MRKLASIQTIKYIKPIPDADNIEVVGVLGWECVSKKGEFKENDKCVFFEIDSLLPEVPEFEFLRKSCWNQVYKKFRLKTVRLRKQLSQGLALPLSVFPNLKEVEIGTDLTDFLGVEKYDPPIPTEISGDAKRFSWPISRTDETRIQLDDEYGFIKNLTGKPYYITLKLDGTSSSFLIHPNDETYHVCGRNYSYKESEDHTFWKLSRRYKIEEGLRNLWKKGFRIAVQAECVGPGIQKNPLGLANPDLYVFNVVDVSTNQKLELEKSLTVTDLLGLKFAPVLEKGLFFNYSKDELLEKAKLKYSDFFDSAKPLQDAEGIVVRSVCGNISFKAINNNFLLKE